MSSHLEYQQQSKRSRPLISIPGDLIRPLRSDSIRHAIFFPRVILYNFFSFLLIYLCLGFWGWGLRLSFLGLSFQLAGFGACGVGPSEVFFGLGLFI